MNDHHTAIVGDALSEGRGMEINECQSIPKQTPTPWVVGNGDHTSIIGPKGESVTSSFFLHGVGKKADSIRIVKCVNACAGMDDPAAAIAELTEYNARLDQEHVAQSLAYHKLLDEKARAKQELVDSKELVKKLGGESLNNFMAAAKLKQELSEVRQQLADSDKQSDNRLAEIESCRAELKILFDAFSVGSFSALLEKAKQLAAAQIRGIVMVDYYYCRSGDDEFYELECSFTQDAWRYILREVAKDYHDEHDGWEATWPIDFELFTPEKIYLHRPATSHKDSVFSAQWFRSAANAPNVSAGYISEEVAMCWVKVAEADLKDGEVVDVLTSGKMRWPECRYQSFDSKFLSANWAALPLSDITHILRIKGPRHE